MRHRFLMCPPTHYRVEYSINAWMEGNRDRARTELAEREWNALYALLSEHADIDLLDAVPDLPDLTFAGCAGLVVGGTAYLSRFRFPERRSEEPYWRRAFEERGLSVVEMPPDVVFEGAADAVMPHGTGPVWLGYGFRTDLEAGDFLARRLGCEVVPLKLADERFFQLSMCFATLEGGYLLYYPGAFDSRSLREIERRVPPEHRYAVNERDALTLCCSCVETNGAVLLARASAEIERVLGGWGKRAIATDLREFMLAGGAARCLTLRLDEPPPAASTAGEARTVSRATVAFRSGLSPALVLEDANELSARTGVEIELLPGTRSRHQAFAVEVRGPDDETLESVLRELAGRGGMTSFPFSIEARLEEVDQDGVAPLGFYGTTIFATEVFHGGRWLRAARQRMDAVLVVDPAARTVRCSLIRDLRRGERVVVGHDGVRTVLPPGRQAESEESEAFSFMSSQASTERRAETAVESIAWEMQRLKSEGSRIVFVAGPVVIHTGGGPYLEKLIAAGYVSALLGGNAIAVHDIENSIYGTSLGVNLKRGTPMRGGHMHHISVINEVRRHGSIEKAVRAGYVRSGIFRTLVECGVPFSLAGSIRDDGPLPDTIMDLIEAQRDYARLLEGAGMIVMLSSMLHSIGVGNMTPAGVRLVCVDINVAVATKLADRGSVDSTPVVTDVGLFLNLLWRRLSEGQG